MDLGELSLEKSQLGKTVIAGGLFQYWKCSSLILHKQPSQRHLHNEGNSSENPNSANYCLSQFLDLLFEHQIVRIIPSWRCYKFSQILNEKNRPEILGQYT